MKRYGAILCALLLARALPGLSLPAGWDLGTVGDTKPVSITFSALNDETRAVSVRFISPCDCLTISPAELTLAPGKSARLKVSFDPTGYSGEVRKPVLVRITGSADRLFMVTGKVVPERTSLSAYPGECEWCRKQSDAIRRQAYDSWRKQPSVVHYYYSPDCKSCTEFLEAEVPRVEKLIGKKIELDRLDIRGAGVLDELDGMLAGKKLTLTALPVLAAGDTVLMGEKQIKAGFEAEMRKRARAR